MIPLGSRQCRRVGLLGGSFNPAHAGHRHISLLALRLLGLDQVWWLVSPQNPLKQAKGMAPFAERLAQAAQVARHPRIRVSGIEARFGTRYTVDTLTELRRRFPDTQFIWLMGADNLMQIRHWRHWTRIFSLMPIAVFDRPAYSGKALASLAAKRYAAFRRPASAGHRLGDSGTPAWTFFAAATHPASATAIRERRSSALRLSQRPTRPSTALTGTSSTGTSSTGTSIT